MRYIVLAVTALMLLWPLSANAADNKYNITLTHQEDGTILGDFWWNERVVWRVRILSEGAKPVIAGANSRTTVVIPDIVCGIFMLKVYNE